MFAQALELEQKKWCTKAIQRRSRERVSQTVSMHTESQVQIHAVITKEVDTQSEVINCKYVHEGPLASGAGYVVRKIDAASTPLHCVRTPMTCGRRSVVHTMVPRLLAYPLHVRVSQPRARGAWTFRACIVCGEHCRPRLVQYIMAGHDALALRLRRICEQGVLRCNQLI